MRTLRGITATCLVALSATVHAQTGPIAWQSDLTEARRTAAHTDRMVIAYFWGPYCGYCKQMESETLANPGVAATINRHFVPVKINQQTAPEVARNMGVRGLPTTLVLSPEGEIIDRMRGRVPAAELANRLQRISTSLASHRSADAAGPRPPVDGARRTAANRNQPPSSPPSTQAGPPSSLARRANVPPANPRNVPRGTPPGPSQPPAMAGGTQNPASPGTPSAGPQANELVGPRYGSMASQPPSVAGQPPLEPRNPAGAAAHPAYGSYGRGAGQARPAPTGGPRPQPASPWQSAGGDRLAGMAPNHRGPQPPQQPYGPQPPGPQARQVQPQPTQPSQRPATAEQPGTNPPLALDGYCVVSLWHDMKSRNRRWTVGDKSHGVIHRGRTYLFSDADKARRFFENPDRYAPVYSGCDVVVAAEQGRKIEGQRSHGAMFGDRIYLFSSEESLQKFENNPNRYAGLAHEGLRTGFIPRASMPR